MALDPDKHPRDPRTGRFISVGSKLAQEINAARSKQGAGKFPKLGAKLSGHETKAELQVVAKKAGISTKKSDTRAALIARIESGEKAKAPAAKPKANRAESNIRAAQVRQERIDVQRAASIVAADIDEIRHKGADLELIQERLMTHAELLATSPQHTRKGRRADIDALAGQIRGLAGAKSVDAIQGDLRTMQGDLGAKPVGKAGEKVSFDPKVHEPLAGDPKPGSQVEVIRAGSRTDDGTLLERPVVITVGSPPSKAVKPNFAKKATPAAAPRATRLDAAAVDDVIRELGGSAGMGPRVITTAQLRERFPDMSMDEFKATIKQMERDGKIDLQSYPDQKMLTKDEIDASISIGNGQLVTMVGSKNGDVQGPNETMYRQDWKDAYTRPTAEQEAAAKAGTKARRDARAAKIEAEKAAKADRFIAGTHQLLMAAKTEAAARDLVADLDDHELPAMAKRMGFTPSPGMSADALREKIVSLSGKSRR